MTRFLNALVSASTLIGAATLILMMIVIVSDVLTTNVFNFRLPAASAIVTSYFMILTVFVPMALAQQTDRHVVVDVVYEMMPPFLRRAMDWISGLVSLAVCCALVYALWGDALRKTQVSSFVFEQNVRVPTWPGYYALPLGFGLMALVLLHQLVRLSKKSAKGNEAPE